MKSILITGCSSGIGYDAAHTLAARGWRVFATCRQQKDADRLVNEGLEALSLDYADEAGMKAALAEILARTGGRLDALLMIPALALSSGLSPFVAQNWGAADHARVREGIWLSGRFAFLWGTGVAL